MKSKILKILPSFLLFLAILLLHSVDVARAGEFFGLRSFAEGVGFTTPGDESEPNILQFAGTIIALVLTVSGVVFLGIMIWGGNMWFSARGNEQVVEQARKLIVQAVMGLIVAFAGFGLTSFLVSVLLEATTGETVAPEAPG